MMSECLEEDANAEPVNAQRVVRRALVLAALCCRGSIETGAGQAEAESLHTRILDWIRLLKLEKELEPTEQRVLHGRLGTVRQGDVIEASWSVEGLVILGWALNLLDLPKHDEKVDPYAVTDSLYFLSGDATELMSSARLRSTAELKAYREVAYAIHCRLRGFARRREREDFAAWVEKGWTELLKIDRAHLIVHGDLGIDDREIADAEQERTQTCEWLTLQRHRAIIWLLGGHLVYSETPVDT
jgi:hypothetical protein